MAESRNRFLFARIAMVYGALFFSVGMFMPFLPVWLKSRGLDDVQIGWVLAVQSATRVMASPAVSRFAERLGRLRPVMLACAIGALLGLAWLEFVSGFEAILFVMAVTFVAFAPLMPLTEAYAVMAGRQHRLDYGRMRLWGSALFIAGNLFAGAALDILSIGGLIWLLVMAQSVLFLVLLALPPCKDARKRQDPSALLPEGMMPLRFTSTGFVIFLLCCGLLQGSHAMVYAFSALHWEKAGLSGSVVGLLWGIGVMAEILLFWFSSVLMARVGAVRLLMLAALAGCIRWTGLAMDPSPAFLFPLQMLHGLTFGAAHLGAIEFIRRHAAPDRVASAQALYGAVTGGIFMTLTTWASGSLYRQYDAGAWLVMAGMSILALGLAFALKRVVTPRVPEGAAA